MDREKKPDFLEDARGLSEYTRRLRRDFHRHPELGYREVRTSGIVARELQALGLETRTGVAKTGVVAVLEGEQPGRTILLRFDMDALPVNEETGVEYCSENPGVMHACGHDGHTAIGLTVARILHAHRHELAGTVKFIFQPAEEGLGGAEGMIAEGILENPRPDIALGLHLWNDRQIGWLGVAPGPVMAAGEYFRLRIRGKGGHGALPHLAQDPVVAAAQVVNALQSIVSRNVSPLQTAVVSITTIHGGEVFNVIPPTVEMQGTIRTFELSVREQVIQRFQQVVQGVAEAMGCQVEIDMRKLTPALVNDPEIAAKTSAIASRLFPENIVDTSFQTMGSEDMAYILEAIPGCFPFIGSANPEKGLDAGHHNPRFNFDEEALPIAVALISTTAAELLSK